VAVKKNNAIISKTRAVFGKRLNRSQYDELLGCQTVNDIAVFLRESTEFKDIFENINETIFHRTKLEFLLRERLFRQYAVLCKYDLSSDIKFFRTVIVRGEIEQLLHCIRLLKLGISEEYLFILPDFFNHHTKLDLYRLAQIRSCSELLSACEGTAYKAILTPFLADGEHIEFNSAEHALYSFYYSFSRSIIERHTKGALHRELKKIFGTHADLQNIAHIIRLKKYYNASPEYIRSLMLPLRHSLTREKLEELVTADSSDEVLAYLKNSKYGLQVGDIEHYFIENTIREIEYRVCSKMLHITSNAITTLAAYIFLAEAETKNIINIIEGIRYNLPPSEISKLLVGVER